MDDERDKELQYLQSLLADNEQWLENTLNFVGWSMDHILQQVRPMCFGIQFCMTLLNRKSMFEYLNNISYCNVEINNSL